MNTSVYQYNSSQQFLLDQVNRLQKTGPAHTIRNIAARMGISHTLLVMLLQGKRELRVKHASAIAKGLRLSSQERIYLQALIQTENARDLEEKQLCELWLAELHPTTAPDTRVFDEFELISNWIHMAILSLCEVKDFNSALEAIAKRLGKGVTAHEVRAALERLKKLGLIKMEASGRFSPTQAQITTSDDIASQGVRNYHKQVMDVAKNALEEQSVNEREYQAFSIALPKAKIPLAKEMIRKFRAQFVNAMQANECDEVYQMNIQFFQLTESPAARKQAEDEGVDGHHQIEI